MSHDATVVNLLQVEAEQPLNKVRQGMANRQRIRALIRAYPAVTTSIVEYEMDVDDETRVERKTIQHVLQRLHELGQITRQRRGMGEEFLYRDSERGRGRVKQDDHMVSVAEDWSRMRKGSKRLQIVLEDELPKEFESSKGIIVPDLVFSLLVREQRFYAWETDLGNERGKEAFLKN